MGTHDIGAGARIYLGDAVTPAISNATAAKQAIGSGKAGGLTDRTEYFGSVNVSTSQGTVDITKLNADTYGYWRRFIAGLNNATGSMNYGEDPALTVTRLVAAIRAATAHAQGRGKVDIIVRPFGDAVGKGQIRGTILFGGDMSLGGEVEGEIGGSAPIQFDGPLVVEVQT